MGDDGGCKRSWLGDGPIIEVVSVAPPASEMREGGLVEFRGENFLIRYFDVGDCENIQCSHFQGGLACSGYKACMLLLFHTTLYRRVE